jgi:hypothetical protein
MEQASFRKVKVGQLVKKIPLYTIRMLIATQQPANGTYSEPKESIPQPHILLL